MQTNLTNMRRIQIDLTIFIFIAMIFCSSVLAQDMKTPKLRLESEKNVLELRSEPSTLDWVGELNLNGRSEMFKLYLENTGQNNKATLDKLPSGPMNIPLEKINFNRREISFEFPCKWEI